MDFLPSSAENVVPILTQSVAQDMLASISYPSSVVDVRQYASYYLQLRPYAPNTADIPMLGVWLQWWADPAGTTLVYDEYHEFYCNQRNAPGATFGGFQDVMHGPYMSLTLQNNSAAIDILSTYTLYGTTRVLPGPYVRQIYDYSNLPVVKTDDMLIDFNANINAGASVTVLGNYAYGSAQWYFQSGAAAGFVNMYAGSEGLYEQPVNVAAFVIARNNVALPKRATRVVITNNAGVNGVFIFNLRAQRNTM